MAWDTGLINEQRTAASHTGAHARLLAGPGTGKTFVMARRVLFLLGVRNVPSTQVVALTFTRAAVAELRARVAQDLEPFGAPPPHISTLHSFALRHLLRNVHLTDLPQPLRIADDFEQSEVVVGELKGILNRTADEVYSLLDQLSADWQSLDADAAEWQARFPEPVFLGAWQEHRLIYGYTLRAELIYRLKRAFEADPNLDLGGQIQHLLVDEYQDLNRGDLAVIQALGVRGAEIYVAGDDDQSIYGFRGALPEGIRRFHLDYAGAIDLPLEECQRCGERILAVGQYVARLDPRRIEKRLRPRPGAPPGEVHLLRFSDQFREAAGIAMICRHLCETRGFVPEDFLLLVRGDPKGVFSRPIRTELERAGLPVQSDADPLAPLNEGEGRQFLSMLRLLVNPRDHLAWRVLLQLRNNQLGAVRLGAVYHLARDRGCRFTDALDLVAATPALIPRHGGLVAAEVIATRDLLAGLPPQGDQPLMDWLRVLAARLFADPDAQGSTLALLNRVEQNAGVTTLEELLRALGASLGRYEQERQPGAIGLMTMHQAKGLTARAVIVVAAEREYVPGPRVGAAADDERRLLYVSLTRAKEYLIISQCQRRTWAQRYTGATAGVVTRHLTPFLEGGPVPVEDGEQFVQRMSGAA